MHRPTAAVAPNAGTGPDNAPGGELAIAAALALAAAVSLGLARFSYALLLPPMRADLGWSYFTAGAMNTVNAAGYLLGALLAPHLLRRFDARQFMLAGGVAAALLLALHAVTRHDAVLYVLRLGCGMASAASFVGGGLLAARLAQRAPQRSGLLLGVYYGGVGLGIVASALGVPPLLESAGLGWPVAWAALGALALLLTVGTAAGTGSLAAPPAPGAPRAPFSWRPFAFGLAGYAMFGIGYIGYMTFIITLLREQGLGAGTVVAFYVLLGLGVIASSWLWAGLLQRHRSGLPLSLLNGLLAVATALPLLGAGLGADPVGGTGLATSAAGAAVAAAIASGLLFGGVFLSVVASTTALVRHNVPPAAWPSGIAAFTIVFAFGQIVGPSVVGWIADGPGGLARGFAFSAAALALGSVLAAFQRPVKDGRKSPPGQ
jgi:predicted MFS family arabinose efflux permease